MVADGRSWVWKAALIGLVVGVAIHLSGLLWIRSHGEAGLFVAALPARIFHPGLELANLILYAARVSVRRTDVALVLIGAALNAGLYVGAAGYFRAWRHRGSLGKALLGLLAGIYMLGQVWGIGVFWILYVAIASGRE